MAVIVARNSPNNSPSTALAYGVLIYSALTAIYECWGNYLSVIGFGLYLVNGLLGLIAYATNLFSTSKVDVHGRFCRVCRLICLPVLTASRLVDHSLETRLIIACSSGCLLLGSIIFDVDASKALSISNNISLLAAIFSWPEYNDFGPFWVFSCATWALLYVIYLAPVALGRTVDTLLTAVNILCFSRLIKLH